MASKEMSLTAIPERSLQEKCGIVGIYSPGSSILQQFDNGTTAARALWHRGQHGLGYIINTNLGPEKYIKIGPIDQALPATLRKEYTKRRRKSNWAIFHTRYGTSGNYRESNLQPITVKSPEGIRFSVVHNGEFAINKKIKKHVPENLPKGASDTYIFAKTLQYTQGNTPDEKILNTLQKRNGAYSMLIGTDDALFAARDQFGIRPMVIGKYQNGWIITSETHALDKLGITTEREIKRGEVIKIDKNGITILKEGYDSQGNFCDLEWAYFSRPDSQAPIHENPNDSYHPERWLSKFEFRVRSGIILAQENPIENATLVVGVPDSGVAAGNGYAVGINKPYMQIILRDHYDQNGTVRTFMRDDQMRQICKRVLGKLSMVPNKNIWKNAIVAVVDDSIVRGTTLKTIIRDMFELGAKEVHALSAFPKIKFPCHLGVSMRTGKELIANRNNGDEKEIAKELGATSVRYISPEGFIRARMGNAKTYFPDNPQEIFLRNGGCGGCVTGIHPISKEGVVYQFKS